MQIISFFNAISVNAFCVQTLMRTSHSFANFFNSCLYSFFCQDENHFLSFKFYKAFRFYRIFEDAERRRKPARLSRFQPFSHSNRFPAFFANPANSNGFFQ